MELCIDTSTRYASVSISDQGAIISNLSWLSNQNHSSELLPAVQYIMNQAKLRTPDINCIITATGPGRFSSLRVGLSTAKGLSFSLKIPLIGLSTLAIEAYPFRNLGLSICPTIDMGRGEIAYAVYSGENGPWYRLQEDRIVTPEELCSTIQDPTIYCGEGATIFRHVLEQYMGDDSKIAHQSLPTRTPNSMAALGIKRFLSGEQDDPGALEPTYLRNPSITTSLRKGKKPIIDNSS